MGAEIKGKKVYLLTAEVTEELENHFHRVFASRDEAGAAMDKMIRDYCNQFDLDYNEEVDDSGTSFSQAAMYGKFYISTDGDAYAWISLEACTIE